MSTLTALAIAGGIVAVTAGVALVVVRPAGSFTARGSVILDRACATYGTDDGDVRDGAQITVRSDGQVVALGRLREGEQRDNGPVSLCRFPLVIDDVPAGHEFYEVEVAHRGAVTYSEADLRDGLRLTLD
ncbi:hypothetical protein [Nakamurella multipartita]|jgi:hypothetical protein|uniref:Uncharacterized protein n=1 Tax=Nakamurella multipartita (strain ATCC 700099 / DSM 44233 / CIP 104796 / JCM 9543 / NBRC 105858 / Y-104) TaxID=479431 RepID=C8XHC2_NAKMY|nr:hypothetical protein [Nakamurella multipartita]ACV78328.1 hypothetical protein Namu_1939 [Nakamurella multipartita DSM 44233]